MYKVTNLMQIAFSPVFDLYHNYGYIITFSTFRFSVFANGRFLFLTCYCAKCSLYQYCSLGLSAQE